MLSPAILVPAILNGVLTGAVYALVALGLTLIYGVLHIINFAHGAMLTAAMFAAFFAHQFFGLDPYVAAIFLRSEERRVGKECRCLCSALREIKKECDWIW